MAPLISIPEAGPLRSRLSLPPPERPLTQVTPDVLERLVLNIRSDFGCVAIIAAFLIIMISTIVFADVITPPAANPFV